MIHIAERLEAIRERMASACARSGREKDSVALLAVSKTVPSTAIREAFDAGQMDFGESRQQEASDKIAELPDSARWHFIGKLQRNKVRKVLESFTTLHSIDSMKLALHTNRIAGELGVSPEIYLEVNLGAELSKGGFDEDELRQQIGPLLELPNLQIRGLMVIPPVGEAPEASRSWFAKARSVRDDLERETGKALKGLSMGMSADFEVAIEEGSTVIRVGSSIFGGRDYN